MQRPILTRRPLVALVAAGAMLAAAAWFWHDRATAVRVAPARRGEAVELVYATGFVEPQHPVNLSSQLIAPVLAITAEEGDRVRRGQPLILLDAAEPRGRLDQAAAERLGAELAEHRVITLFDQGWITRAARDQAVATASAARAGERAAQARVANNIVPASIDGIVLKRDVEPGDIAVPGVVLMQLGDPSRVQITTTVDERDIIRVRPGQRVLLSSESLPGRILEGTVRTITPGGDPTQRAFRVRIHLDQPVELPFGLTLEANIITARHPRALLVPASAYAGKAVWIVDENGRARRRAVTPGIIGRDAIEILGGLREGEGVIVTPPEAIANGVRVRVTR